MGRSNSNDPLAGLLGLLHPEIREAAICCSVPHWFDRELGVAVIERFIELNPSAEQVFAELIELPFVFSRDDGEWEYGPSVRSSLRSSLIQQETRFAQISTFLAEYLRADRDEITDSADWNARQLDWQIAYHWAPGRPDVAAQQLLEFTESAARAHRTADIKVVAEVCDEQVEWLPWAHVSYIKGRYAHARKDWRTAENYLREVWDSGLSDSRMMASTGFLLGVIWRHRGKQAWLEKAEDILRKSLHMCDNLVKVGQYDIKELKAQVLNSLGATLIDQGGYQRCIEADLLLEESLLIGEELRDESHRGRVFNTQGTLLAKSESRREQLEAVELLRASLKIGEKLHSRRHKAKALNSLGQVQVRLGGAKQWEAAEKYYRRSLDLCEELGDAHSIAQVLQNLGDLLVMLGGAAREDEAEQLFRRSLEIWTELDNARGLILSLTSLGNLLVKMGRMEDGEKYLTLAGEIEP